MNLFENVVPNLNKGQTIKFEYFQLLTNQPDLIPTEIPFLQEYFNILKSCIVPILKGIKNTVYINYNDNEEFCWFLIDRTLVDLREYTQKHNLNLDVYLICFYEHISGNSSEFEWKYVKNPDLITNKQKTLMKIPENPLISETDINIIILLDYHKVRMHYKEIGRPIVDNTLISIFPKSTWLIPIIEINPNDYFINRKEIITLPPVTESVKKEILTDRYRRAIKEHQGLLIDNEIFEDLSKYPSIELALEKLHTLVEESLINDEESLIATSVLQKKILMPNLPSSLETLNSNELQILTRVSFFNFHQLGELDFVDLAEWYYNHLNQRQGYEFENSIENMVRKDILVKRRKGLGKGKGVTILLDVSHSINISVLWKYLSVDGQLSPAIITLTDKPYFLPYDLFKGRVLWEQFFTTRSYVNTFPEKYSEYPSSQFLVYRIYSTFSSLNQMWGDPFYFNSNKTNCYWVLKDYLMETDNIDKKVYHFTYIIYFETDISSNSYIFDKTGWARVVVYSDLKQKLPDEPGGHYISLFITKLEEIARKNNLTIIKFNGGFWFAIGSYEFVRGAIPPNDSEATHLLNWLESRTLLPM